MSENIGHNSADADFRSIIDRILRCREDEDEAKAATKDVYVEAAAKGYDKTAIGSLVTELRKREKNPASYEEKQAILDLYRDAYQRALTHTHAREVLS